MLGNVTVFSAQPPLSFWSLSLLKKYTLRCGDQQTPHTYTLPASSSAHSSFLQKQFMDTSSPSWSLKYSFTLANIPVGLQGHGFSGQPGTDRQMVSTHMTMQRPIWKKLAPIHSYTLSFSGPAPNTLGLSWGPAIQLWLTAVQILLFSHCQLLAAYSHDYFLLIVDSKAMSLSL